MGSATYTKRPVLMLYWCLIDGIVLAAPVGLRRRHVQHDASDVLLFYMLQQ